MLKQPARTSLSDFIKTTMGSQFVIPVYQRNYTWNPEKETARFMNDIENLLTRRTANHFLGIIIYKESQVAAMFRQLQIVDGQQRMTTAFIFLLALKNEALTRNDPAVAGMIDDYYLYNRHAGEESKMRLKPAISNDDVYARLIYGSPDDLSRREKESGVFRNYDYMAKRIREMASDHMLVEILDTLAKVDILEFPLSDTDNSQQIFESINATGAPLTSADLIRNFILMNHTDEEQERLYGMYWQPLENYYPESRKLEDFFRCYLAVKTYSLLSRRDVYEGFKNYWDDEVENDESAMQDICRYCRYMYEIYNGPSPGKLAEKALADFRKTGSRLPAAFLMEMYHLYDTGRISEREFTALVRLIDSYMVRRALCGNDPGVLNRYFPTLLRSVLSAFNDQKKQDIITLTKVNLINYNRNNALAMPTDEQLRTQLREINAYALTCIRPVLERIEHHGANARVDVSDLNIEHIMPQNPNAWWKKNAGTTDDDDYTATVNLIGNLTLCAEYDNSLMGNKDFAYKKQVLARTLHIRMNTEILKKNSWNKKEIIKRCDELSSTIIACYPYGPGRDSYAVRNNDTVVLFSNAVEARALIRRDHRIEVMTGTRMKAYGANEMKTNTVLFNDMYGRGILRDTQDGKIEFVRRYVFENLSAAAGFLTHRGGDNTALWKYEDGRSLSGSASALKKKEKRQVKPEDGRNIEKRVFKRRSDLKKAAEKPAENNDTNVKSQKKQVFTKVTRKRSGIKPQKDKKKPDNVARVRFTGEED